MKETVHVKLPIALTVQHVAVTRDALIAAVRSGQPLELDASQVTEIDVAGLQLLCALHRATIGQGTTVQFEGQCRGTVIGEALVTAGFVRHKGCAPGCLWEGKRRG